MAAFSGLYAPHWRSDARGLFIGLSQHTTKAHLLRAIVDGMCFRIKEVIEAMERDAVEKLARLKVDGGVTVNNFIMQNQADALGEIVERKSETEMTALGCAIASGMAKDIKLWDSLNSLANYVKVAREFTPQKDLSLYQRKWQEAVRRSLNWASA